MFELSYFALFLAGLLGGGHCAGMCGGIVAAFSFQLPNTSRWLWHFCFNFGRILGYGLIGFFLAGLANLVTQHSLYAVQRSLMVFAQLLLLGMGLQIAGWAFWIRHIEKLGQPIWRYLKPVLARMLPVRTFWQCVVAGLLWGWLPCGLVYTASLAAMSSANPYQGATLMMMFGLGTLPNLLLIAVGSELLKDWMRKLWVRRGMGLILISMSVTSLILLALPKS